MKREVRLFVSYAHRNTALVARFIEQLSQHLNASKHFHYNLWKDDRLLLGQTWQEKIEAQLAECDAALLLLSPAFLGSTYIMNQELPRLQKDGKLLFPVALHQLDFAYHDLQGLEEKQVFLLNNKDFTQPRSYYEVSPKRQEEFTLALFRQIEDRLIKELPKI